MKRKTARQPGGDGGRQRAAGAVGVPRRDARRRKAPDAAPLDQKIRRFIRKESIDPAVFNTLSTRAGNPKGGEVIHASPFE